MRPRSFQFLLLEDLFYEKRCFQSQIRQLFSTEKVSFSIIESIFSLKTQYPEKKEEAKLNEKNFHRFKRNNSLEYIEKMTYDSYMKYILKIKKNLLLNIFFILLVRSDNPSSNSQITPRYHAEKVFFLRFNK